MPEQDLKEEDLPKQEQTLPGKESEMVPEPEIIRDDYKGSDKLKGRVALITGGDSGIGRSVAVHFAREGAKVAIVYLEEDEDAEKTRELVEQENSECLIIRGDIRDREFCRQCVEQVIDNFGTLNILVNNAAEQHSQQGIESRRPGYHGKDVSDQYYFDVLSYAGRSKTYECRGFDYQYYQYCCLSGT